MIVKCGRCQVELEVAGPGEFMCPACGSRNVVRGGAAAPPADPFAMSPSPLTTGAPPAGPPPPAPDVRWVTCPSCSYRFVIGEVEEAPCPACAARLAVTPENVQVINP